MKYYVPALLWALTILVLSITPAHQLPETDFRLADKLAHLAVYFLLSVLLWYAVMRNGHYTARLFITFSLLFGLGLFYGIAIELAQAYLIPSRFGEVEDAVANGLGSFFGLIVGKLWIKHP
jgi:VanZ family protein